MVKKILLDNYEINFSEADLPILIHGKEHAQAGSSLFTVSLVVNLYTQGFKILFLSGYHMARDELLAQVGDENDSILPDSANFNVDDIKDKKIIFVKRENPEAFIELVKNLPDINERIILVKNVDLFSEEIFDSVKDYSKVIISGDIEKCLFADKILGKKYNTKIAFSQSEANLGIELPELKPYEGYLRGQGKMGFVKLKI